MLSRLLTRKEQAVLVALAASVCVGAAALYAHGLRAPSSPEAQATTLSVEVPVQRLESPAPVLTGELSLASVEKPEVTPEVLPTPIVVAAEGAVYQPGVYRMLPEARVQDLLDMAGGTTETADLSDLNRAALLLDGTTVNVPYKPVARVEGEAMVLRRTPVAAELNLSAYTLSGSRPLAASQQLNAAPAAVSSSGTPSVGQAQGPLDLNRASEDALCDLPGIGPALAARIAAHRAQTPFQSVEDLADVPGIGVKKLEAVRSLVAIYP